MPVMCLHVVGRIQSFDKASDPWLYLHAEGILNRIKDTEKSYKESIPIKTYFFRYDRGVFWSGLRAFKVSQSALPVARVELMSTSTFARRSMLLLGIC